MEIEKHYQVAIYVRVSTTEQADEGYSIDQQEERLRKYCDLKDWNVANVYVDGGFSGSNIERPAMKQLINSVEKNEVDVVLVYKLDRLSRSQKDTLHLIEDIFEPHNVSFVSLNENFDTSTPFGRASIGILSVFAQLEREQIKDRMMMGKFGKIKKGYFLGNGNQPFGYDYIDGKLVVNNQEARIVRLMFDLAEKDYSFNKIRNELVSLGIKTRTGKLFDARAISYMLHNETYIGKLNWQGNQYKGSHEPLVNEIQFFKVQSLMKVRKDIVYKTHTRPYQAKYPLSSVLYCGICGAKFSMYTTRNRREGGYYYYYKCSSLMSRHQDKASNEKCTSDIYKMSELNEMVFKRIKKLALSDKSVEKLINKNSNKPNKTIQIVETSLEKNQEKYSRMLDLYQNGSISFNKVESRLNELEKEKSELSNQLDNLKQIEIEKSANNDVLKILKSANEIIENGTNADKLKLVNKIITKITLKHDKISIHWNF